MSAKDNNNKQATQEEQTQDDRHDVASLSQLFKSQKLDNVRERLRCIIETNSLDCRQLVDLAKTSKKAAGFVKELINGHGVDENELVDCIAKEIIGDIGEFVNELLSKYRKFTLNAPQMLFDVKGSTMKFFNLIGLLRDVSVLGRKLLETAPQFESLRSQTVAPPVLEHQQTSDHKRLFFNRTRLEVKSQSAANNEEDATSEDLLAALIESSSSDDFLVLSSSLDSITMRDMILGALILIKTHECFTLSHDVQGVVMVLRRTKFMILNILAPKNQMELVTKLLTSIGRYNEMNYVFDLLRDHNQFEILLSKGVEKTPELRIALFNYVKKNPEFYALVMLNFSMFREIAESLEASASRRLDKLIQARRGKTTKKISTSGQWQEALASRKDSAALCGPPSATLPPSPSPPLQRQQQLPPSSSSSSSSSASGKQPALDQMGSLSSPTATTTTTTTSVETTHATVGRHPQTSGVGDDGKGSGSNKSLAKPLYSREALGLCLVELVDASDCFAKAGCYKRSNGCESKAKLIALQLAFLEAGETNVLDLQQGGSELNDLIVSLDNFSDAYIVVEAYSYHLSWRQALFRNVILGGQLTYLNEYCRRYDLSCAIVMELVVLYKQHLASHSHLSQEELSRLAESMRWILLRLEDVELRCKIYSQLNFQDAKEELLEDGAVRAHLRDLRLA